MKIRIRNLRVGAFIGVHPHEQKHRQDVVINVEIDFDGTKAAASDDLNDTINYAAVEQAIFEHIRGGRFQLLERLTGEVLSIVMADPRAAAAVVEVAKPGALRHAESVSVTASARSR